MQAFRRILLLSRLESRHISTKAVTEVNIPVPWGHIAGKWWGTRDKQPIIALHGIEDNAATFDSLIPLLDTGGVPIFAVDLPGHGKSNALPLGYLPHYPDCLLILRLICKHVFKGWGKMNFLSHSFGSSLCFAYAGIYPGEVKSFVSIECARLRMVSSKPDNMRKTIEKVIEYSVKGAKEPPSYTYEEILNRMYEGRKKRVSLKSCKVLLSRGLTESSTKGKFYFSRDFTTKLPAPGQFSIDYLNELTSRITSNFLAIEGETGVYAKQGPLRDCFLSQLKTIEGNVKHFNHALIPGEGHHLHLDAPEKIAPILNDFYSKGKLWGESTRQPMLALHGWQDNASTFDYLIDSLKIDRPVLALDFPGHGFSSPIFPFLPYHEIDTVSSVRWVQRHFGWEKMILLGHSLGAVTSFLFSGIYPNAVEAMINLDMVKPVEQPKKERADLMGPLIDKIITLGQRSESDTGYSKQEIENRWIQAGKLSQKSAQKLLERGCREIKPGTYKFIRDPRLKAWQMHRWECSENMEVASNIKCPVLMVKGNKSEFFDWSVKGCPNILDKIKSSAKSFQLETVEGSHHFHIDNPQAVANVIERFLENIDLKT